MSRPKPPVLVSSTRIIKLTITDRELNHMLHAIKYCIALDRDCRYQITSDYITLSRKLRHIRRQST